MKRIICAALLLIGASAFAQDAPALVTWRPFVGAGLTYGGDRLARVEYTNDTSETLHAGGIVHLVAGVDARFTPLVSAQLNIGYHVDSTSGSDASLRFQRFPVELLAYLSVNEKFRIGGGARFVSGAKVTGSGVFDSAHAEFESTTGAVIEGEYFITPKVGVKLRAVSEKYKLKYDSDKIDGSHGGVYLNYYFL